MKKGGLLNAVVGGFVVCASAPSTPRGDAMWTVACKHCGRQYTMRATTIRNAMRFNKHLRVCDCELEAIREEKRKEKVNLAQASEIRKQQAKEYKEYSDRHILLYYTWQGMKSRCYRKTHVKFKHYGARGITVCNEWLHDFRTFCEWSLAHGYRQGLTIDRIDNDSGYRPDNCRWTTYVVQNNNRRPSRRQEYRGPGSETKRPRVSRGPKFV